jgi:transcriptional regulator NrdR family protein
VKTSVFAQCPFCGGQTSLVHDDAHTHDSEIVERFRGRRINCSHRGCGESFAIRRENIKIRHFEE